MVHSRKPTVYYKLEGVVVWWSAGFGKPDDVVVVWWSGLAWAARDGNDPPLILLSHKQTLAAARDPGIQLPLDR